MVRLATCTIVHREKQQQFIMTKSALLLHDAMYRIRTGDTKIYKLESIKFKNSKVRQAGQPKTRFVKLALQNVLSSRLQSFAKAKARPFDLDIKNSEGQGVGLQNLMNLRR